MQSAQTWVSWVEQQVNTTHLAVFYLWESILGEWTGVLFTKPVVRTKFVQLLSIERKFYDRGEAVVRIA